MSFNRIKRLAIPLSILVFLAFSVAILMSIYAPKITIQVGEGHDPLNNTVLLNGKALVPQGEGGRTYKATISRGSNSVKLVGPYIQEAAQEIAGGVIGDSQYLEMPIKNKTPEEVAKAALKAETVETKAVSENSMVVEVVNGPANTEGDTTYLSLLIYESTTGVWSDKTDSYRNGYIDSRITNRQKSLLEEASYD